MAGPKSIVLRSAVLSHLHRCTDEATITFLIGLPFSGKSTLLHQLMASLPPQSFQFFNNDFDIRALAEVDATKITIIDSKGFVVTPELFETLKATPEKRFIITQMSMPALSAGDLLDVGIFNIPPFGEEDAVLLGKAGNVKIERDTLSALQEESSGNPLFLKYILGSAIKLQLETLDNQSLDRCVSVAASELITFLSNSQDQDVLRALACIDLETEVPHLLPSQPKWSRELHPYLTLFRNLKIFGKAGAVQLAAHVQRNVLSLLEQLGTGKACAELIKRQTASGRYDEALASLEKHLVEIQKEGNNDTVIDITQDYKEKLSTPAFIIRNEALFQKFGIDGCIHELDQRLNEAKTFEDRKVLLPIIGKRYRQHANQPEALKFLDEFLMTCPLNDVAYPTALYQKALLLTEQDLKKSETLLLSAVNSCLSHFAEEAQLLGEIYHQLNRIAWTLKDYVNSQKYIDKALEQLRKVGSGISYESLLSQYNLGATLYSSGYTKRAIRLWNEVEVQSASLNFKYITQLCVLARALIQSNQGHFKTALNLFPRIESYTENPSLRTLPAFVSEYKALILLRNRKELASLALYESLSTLPLIQRDKAKLTLYDGYCVALRCCVKNEGRRTAGKRLLTVSKELSLGNNLFFLMNILELNYRHYFTLDLEPLYLDSDQLLSVTAVSVCHTRTLIGIHLINSGQLKRAQEELNLSRGDAIRLEYPFWVMRSSTFLAVLAVHNGQMEEAHTYISEAKKAANEVEDTQEVEFCSLVEAAILIKESHTTQASSILNTVSKNSPNAYFASALVGILQTHHTRNEFVVPRERKRWFDLLLELMDVGPTKKVIVTTNRNRYEVFYNSINVDRLKQSDILIDEVNGTISVAKSTAAISNHTIVYPLLKYLLSRLGEFFSKETLVTHVWHENYNPLVHDSRIYVAVRRLRDLLDKKSHLLVTKDGKYGMSSDTKFALIAEFRSNPLQLSDRQKWVIKFIERNGRIERRTLAKHLKISPATAKLDLQDLVSRGLLVMNGSGRSSHYIRAS
jgi:DNA-binding winged helix-turn-helix (wHTH) protein